MDPALAARTLIGVRLAVGLGAWLAPELSSRLFGIRAEDNPQASYLGRLFGARDVALAVGLQGAGDAERGRWLTLGLACDAADVLAALAGGRNGSLSPATAVLGGGVAAGAVALGVVALRAEGAMQHPVPVASPAAATPAV